MQSTRSKRNEGISAQLRSLNFVNKKIEKLEEQLANARRERDRLETEIALYHASNAPIRRLPPELLVMIFEEYVVDQHPHIQYLMLVCRNWYQLVVNTPRLWVYIQVNIDLGSPNQCAFAIEYVDACLRQSKGGLLHVVVDFGNFPNQFEYMDSIIGNSFRTLTNYEEYWFDTIDPSEFYCPAYIRDIYECRKLVKRLASRSKRWGSLTIDLRGDEMYDLFETIWPELQREAPKLTELVLRGVTTHGEWDNSFTASPLKRLDISDQGILAKLASSKPPLETLVCHLDPAENFGHIYSFGNLRELTLIGSHESEEPTSHSFGSEKLRLPLLCYLSLQRAIPSGIIQLLDAPVLKQLHMYKIPYKNFNVMPDVSPASVIWRVSKRTTWHRKRPASTEALRALFSKYPKMESFETYKYHMKHVMLLIAEIREEDAGLQRLKSVTFVEIAQYDWGEIESKGSLESSMTVDTSVGRTRDELLDGVDLVSEVTSTSSEDDPPRTAVYEDENEGSDVEED